MLIILILLLKFIDFELSGQNIETEAMLLKNLKNWIFILNETYLLYCMYDACISTKRKNNKPVYSENLTSGQLFFKEGLLIWLILSLIWNCLDIAYTLYRIQNYNKFRKLNANISIFQEKIILSNLF